jgi:hypothetical protein
MQGAYHRRFNTAGTPESNITSLPVCYGTSFSVRKLLVMCFFQEVLREHTTVFWMDASVRFKTSNLDVIRKQAVSVSRGFLMFDWTGHTIFAATHATMYRYLPIAELAATRVPMMGANSIYIHCSREVMNGRYIVVDLSPI